ncbi:MAG: transglutaminase-like domain-containing protein [Phycisphaerae bacterium]
MKSLCRLFLIVLSFSAVGCSAPSRHFVFTYNVDVRDLPATARDIAVWLPVPPETAEQHVLSMAVSAPVDGRIQTEPVYGNRVWYARATGPRRRTLHITQRAEISRRPQRGFAQSADPHAPPTATENMDVFLKPNRLVPLTRRFADIAAEQTHGLSDSVAKARVLYDYVLNRMDYDKSGHGWGRGDAIRACDVGTGNCTDFHSLFIGLARSIGLPARFRIGFPLPPDRGRGVVAGYHCWAEFWTADHGWVPVDISEADKHPERAEFFFGNLDENRLVCSSGRDLILPPGQKGPPVNFFIYPYVEVDGEPWDAVDYRFTFEDVPGPGR